MRRLLVLLLLSASCGRDPVQPRPSAPSTEAMAGEVAIARAGCIRCHAAEAPLAARLLPTPGPALDDVVRWRAADGGAAFLQRHHGGAAARDLAAWLTALAAGVPAPSATVTTAAALRTGERLWRELACAACHTDANMAELAARTDHTRLASFLQAPATHRPGHLHLALTGAEAEAVAAWLLRAQQTTSMAPGFGWACFARRITAAGLPDLAGVAPAATGVSDHIGVDVRAQDQHFVLRFDATLDVPAAGEWTFVTDSDDSSWLWIDGELVVKNEGLAPHRRAEGRATLAAGPHELRVVYTQAAGERVLAARWRGPGVDEQDLPAARAAVHQVVLTPPPPPPAAAAEAIERGRGAAVQQRCDACHPIAEPAFAAARAAASSPAARPFAALGDGACPQSPAAKALLASSRELLAQPAPAKAALGTALIADGCLSCHVRDGRGGLPPVVQQGLAVIEDLGDEGRLPPNLSDVGRRLQPKWIEAVLHEGRSVRPYLRVRMPAMPAERAAAYARWFAEVDRMPPPEPAVAFSASSVHQGRDFVGLGGRNCITCHRVQGLPALGIQGMDLAIQAERLQPAWLREWLLRPDTLRPNTRMPRLWPVGDANDRAEIAAIMAWLQLGPAAPLPRGVPLPDALVLEPIDRVLQHAAFLDGLSARGLAVGTPERAHYAFDLTTARLRWLWRGAFLDAAGTWQGRAGKLLRPKGRDWLVLEDAGIADGAERRVLGRRVTKDGYPVLHIAAGGAEYEDEVRARLAPGKSELVRTLRCTKGTLPVDLTADRDAAKASVGGVPAGRFELAAGQSLEVVYAW
ncbi:MAG: hypothetical protein JNN13_16370 [Planctomycetes bacterium]|nr:hypothetical protein [Planctomycetota bacterium]